MVLCGKGLQILMALTLILICNMLIYSVLSIPLYRIICTTSTVGTDASSSMISVIGTVTGVLLVGQSIHYFMYTAVFATESSGNIFTCCNYVHDLLNAFTHYTPQTTVANEVIDIYYTAPANLIRFTIIDVELSSISSIFHNYDIPYTSDSVLTCKQAIVEIEQLLYKVSIALENKFGVEANQKQQQIYEVLFSTRCSTKGIIEFYALQERVFVITGETTLVFFRVHNPTTYNISCLTVYFLYPDYLSIYFYKLQCFCFEILHLESKEVLDLPVLFYISHDIVADVRISNKFIVYYVLFPLERMQLGTMGIEQTPRY